MSEEDAIKKYKEENIEVYHTSYKPLEWNLSDSHQDSDCFTKVVVHIPSDKVLGIHFVGPHAGEVIMGFSVAMKCGVTKT